MKVMDQMTSRRQTLVDDEARAWLLRQADGALRPEDQQAFKAWLAADAMNWFSSLSGSST